MVNKVQCEIHSVRITDGARPNGLIYVYMNSRSFSRLF